MRPRAARVLVRLALLHLVGGAALGAAVLAARVGACPTLPAGAVAAHAELVLLGWLVQLAMGVALWILPRALAGGPAGAGRSDAPGWTLVVLLNAGVLAAVAASAGVLPPALLPAGRVSSAAAVALFARHAGRRIAVAAAVRRRARGAGAARS